MLVVFRAAATVDVEASYEWYESQRRGLGSEFRTEVDAAVELISGTPLAFPLVRPNVRRALLRRFPYALFYRVVGDEAVVEALHPRETAPKGVALSHMRSNDALSLTKGAWWRALDSVCAPASS